MANPTTARNTLEKNAQKYFRKAEQSDMLAKKIHKTERAANASKTAKLRGLRLAKELADKKEAEKLAAEQPANAAPQHQVRGKRTTTVRPARMLRLVY